MSTGVDFAMASTREIAEVIGASKSTIADDIAAVQNRTTEPPERVDSVQDRTLAPLDAVAALASPFTSRRRFLVWAVLCGYVKPERLTERIVAEVESEVRT